jgi:tRNA nucleotidyltransferase (CCA-adding enzyme)
MLAGLAGAQAVEAQLALMERCDALRKPERFFELLRAANVLRGKASGLSQAAPEDIWRARVAAVRGVDAGAIARECGGAPEKIKPALRDARLAALAAL